MGTLGVLTRHQLRSFILNRSARGAGRPIYADLNHAYGFLHRLDIPSSGPLCVRCSDKTIPNLGMGCCNMTPKGLVSWAGLLRGYGLPHYLFLVFWHFFVVVSTSLFLVA